MSDRGSKTGKRAGTGRAVLPVSDVLGTSRDQDRGSARAGSHAVPAFIAQLFAARVRRRRLAIAREDAPSIHKAYRRGDTARLNVRTIDISV